VNSALPTSQDPCLYWDFNKASLCVNTGRNLTSFHSQALSRHRRPRSALWHRLIGMCLNSVVKNFLQEDLWICEIRPFQKTFCLAYDVCVGVAWSLSFCCNVKMQPTRALYEPLIWNLSTFSIWKVDGFESWTSCCPRKHWNLSINNSKMADTFFATCLSGLYVIWKLKPSTLNTNYDMIAFFSLLW
jgi:hypothetical protein